MPDTLFIVKGILNDGCRDDKEPNVLIKTFILRHGTPDEVGEIVRKTLMDIKECGGIFFTKDELKIKSLENSRFVMNHMFAYVEFETKTLTGQYTQNDGGLKQ